MITGTDKNGMKYTLDLEAAVKNGRSGYCCCCGQCCEKALCGHLEVLTVIGEPLSTRCKIYSNRPWEGYKSCVSFPSEKYEIENYTSCTYRFR